MSKTVKVNVVETFIYPQAAARLYSVMQADDGTIRRMDFAESNVLVIDGGHGQVNVALVQAMNPIKKACFATDDGFYKVALDVQNYLNVQLVIRWPFHGGDTSSNLVRTTKRKLNQLKAGFLYCSDLAIILRYKEEED